MHRKVSSAIASFQQVERHNKIEDLILQKKIVSLEQEKSIRERQINLDMKLLKLRHQRRHQHDRGGRQTGKDAGAELPVRFSQPTQRVFIITITDLSELDKGMILDSKRPKTTAGSTDWNRYSTDKRRGRFSQSAFPAFRKASSPNSREIYSSSQQRHSAHTDTGVLRSKTSTTLSSVSLSE